VHDNNYPELWKRITLGTFEKSRSRIKVPSVGRNVVPDTWTADGEGTLLELGPCPHDKSCVSCRGTELVASRFSDVECNDVAEICW